MNQCLYKKFPYRHERGMTLAEVVVVLAILGIISVAIYSFEANVFIHSNTSQTQINNTWQAEALLKPMTKELRAMVPSAIGSYPIASVATNTISFYSDVDNDSAVEKIRYFLATSTLYRGVINPTGNPPTYPSANEQIKILANGVISSSTLPLFEYFNNTFEGTTSPMAWPFDLSTVRLIRINVIIDTDPNRAPAIKTFTSSVSLRNLKNNF